MNTKVTFVLDGRDVEAKPGQTILEAADAAGIYIPRLCYHEDLRARRPLPDLLGQGQREGHQRVHHARHGRDGGREATRRS